MSTRLIVIISVILSSGFSTFGQVFEDFSDSELLLNPHWTGDLNSFQINTDQMLQLNESGSNSKYLSTADTLELNSEWNFYVKLAFAPSNNNYLLFYLAASDTILNDSLQAYFIRIGENGSNDGIDLFYQEGFQTTKIIDGTAGLAANNPEFKIKVTCSTHGKWTLSAAATGSNIYKVQGITTSIPAFKNKAMGMVCHYTSSNSNRFYFDNISHQLIIPDTIAPEISEITSLSTHAIKCIFSEAPDSMSASNTGNYTLMPGNIHPVQVKQIQANEFELSFTDPFIQGGNYQLKAEKVADLEGNLSNSSFAFVFYILMPSDIIINEFMADPSPPAGLPNAEFIELFNKAPVPINLNNWKIADASSDVSIPPYILGKNQFVIICHSADTSNFKPYGNILAVDFPTLNNSGDQIILSDQDGQIIDGLEYDLSWYQDANKAQGGYSLERINPLHPCSNSGNWKASDDAMGGTPGKINSVFSDKKDSLAPFVQSFVFVDSIHVSLTFNEDIDTLNISTANFFTSCKLNISFINIISAEKIILGFDQAFSNLDSCKLSYTGLSDCWGNSKNDTTVLVIKYIIPEQAMPFDLVISELMPDPDPPVKLPSCEYIELFNRSEKYIDLSSLTLFTATSESKLPTYILPPKTWLILCKPEYANQMEAYGKVLAPTSFPTLSNSTGEIGILSPENGLIFRVVYHSSWHSSEFKADGGFSLEMIDVDNYCNPEGNWSSTMDARGGTPGKTNSISAVNPDVIAPEIEKILVEDSLHIQIFFSEQMDTASILDLENYNINYGISKPQAAKCNWLTKDRVVLSLNHALETRRLYNLSCKHIRDCAGNLLNNGLQHMMMPEPADSAAIIINEILFNPYPNSYDFIELLNIGNTCVDLKNLFLAKRGETGLAEDIAVLDAEGFQLLPGEYLVFTEDRADILQNYYCKNPQRILEISNLPAMNDDEGQIMLINKQEQVIDFVIYKDDYHFPLLDDDNGVSLEKINPALSGLNPSNWTSAAKNAGFATPGYQNSQYSENTPQDKHFELSEKIFSPDNDGYNDLMILNYQFDAPNVFGNISVFNTRGILVKQLCNNCSFGTKGMISWNGTGLQDETLAVGVYIIVIEYNDLAGNSNKIKKTVTLSRKW